jgi:peptidoglycan hydrolase-like protein with peptidoglycan-binding domain
LGYGDARADIRGWLSDGTVKALSEFQSASGLAVDGKATPETVEALMSDTEATVTD